MSQEQIEKIVIQSITNAVLAGKQRDGGVLKSDVEVVLQTSLWNQTSVDALMDISKVLGVSPKAIRREPETGEVFSLVLGPK